MKTNKLTLLTFALLTNISAMAQTNICNWVQSTRSSLWVEKAPTSSVESKDVLTLEVNTKNTLQTVDGFGACFNELGWKSLCELSQGQINDIMKELYQSGKGANFTMGRMPLGANDFSLNYYSLNETDGDFDMKNFSIAHDKIILIPFIKTAMKFQPHLKVWASPWCPPKWMKKNKFYAENADVNWNNIILKYKSMANGKEETDPLRFRVEITGNGTPLNAMGFEGVTSFNMQPQYLQAYAKYFGKFVDAYKDEGINIFMVMPQNEPNSAQPYPSCSWTAKDLNTFVGQYLGPEMQKHGVKVFAGTCERPDPLKPDTLLSDPVTSKFISGAGFQWAGKAAIKTIRQKYPALTLYGTEQECGNGLNNWEGAMHSWDLMHEYFKDGVNGYFYWNLSLYENEPSTWGWHQNSLVTVNRVKKTYQFTPEYYVMKHVSHFVQVGAKLLKTSGTLKDALVFLNPDKSVVVIVANQTNQTENVNLKFGKKCILVSLISNSLNTFLLK